MTIVFIDNFIEKLLKLKHTEATVTAIKQDAIDKIDQANSTMQKVGKAQAKVMRKTTTYFIAQATGSLNQ